MAKHELVAALDPGGPGRLRILASMTNRPGWDVEVLVVATDAGPAVSELKLRPHNGPDGAEWRAQGLEMPIGGITTRIMREVNVGELVELARTAARDLEDLNLAVADDPQVSGIVDPASLREFTETMRESAANWQPLTQERKRRGRRGNGIDHYLTWASRYAEKVATGVRNPNAVLAKDFGETPQFVRDTITDARRRYGLLTQGPGRGRAGGTLTPKALALIAQRQPTKEEQ